MNTGCLNLGQLAELSQGYYTRRIYKYETEQRQKAEDDFRLYAEMTPHELDQEFQRIAGRRQHKRGLVLEMVKAHPDLSNTEIARRLGTSDRYVSICVSDYLRGAR